MKHLPHIVDNKHVRSLLSRCSYAGSVESRIQHERYLPIIPFRFPLSNMKTQTELAEKYQCTSRTIRTWQKLKAPLGDEEKMLAWLSSRKSLPPETALWLSARTVERRENMEAAPVAVEKGAAAASARLESSELTSFNDLQRAIAGGDPIEIKAKHDRWLRSSDALRKWDLILTQTERADSVPRRQVERGLFLFAYMIRIALAEVATAMQRFFPDAPGMKLAVDRLNVQYLVAASASLRAFWDDEGGCPSWISNSLGRDALGCLMRFEKGHLDRLAEFMKLFVEGKASVEFVRALNGDVLRKCISEAQARLDAEQKPKE